LLSISDKGESFIKKPEKLEIALDQQFDKVLESDDDANVEAENVYDEVLFGMLKDLTRKVGKQLNLPPYVIFQEPSLEEMAFKFPITIDELSKVSGVNKGKAVKYGKQFVDMIGKYVEENSIDRSEDVVIKSVANKSAKKIAIITNIDKKQRLEDIARSIGLTMPELLDEIQNIIYSGTKLNLQSYVNDVADEDILEEVMAFFRKSQKDSLEEALTEYGSEFSKDDIQLMRIHFISEVAY
jgi:ATP-dependent DNA helicase RecQ